MAINVALETFEGPLSLLLELVRRSEISVWEIRVQSICDQFIAYTKQLETIDVDLAGDFLVMAATLIRIKARLLLPRPEMDTDDDEEEFIDEEEQMIMRLLAYEGYREAAEELEQLAKESQVLYTRGQEVDLPVRKVGDPLAGVTLLTLAVTAQQCIREAQPPPALQVTAEVFTVAGQMAHIEQLVSRQDAQFTFRQLLSTRFTRLEVVATFLAVLELVRLQKIVVGQEHPGDEVKVRRRVMHASV